MSSSYYQGEAVFSAGGILFDSLSQKVHLIFKEEINEWLLPKGRLEEGETVEQCASREIYEETGYENNINKLLSVQIRPDINDPSKSKVIFWFLSIKTDGGQHSNTQKSDEHFVGEWFTKEEAISHLKWDEDRKLVEKVYTLTK